MKRISVLSALMLLLFATSCKKEYITQAIPNTTVVQTVAPSNWTVNPNDGTYNASIQMPEIDQTVFDNDAVVVAASFGGGSYEGLPQVFDGYSYTYFYQPGSVTISIQGANGSEGGRPSGNITFKITLLPSTTVN